ncbi:MAG TPA: ABC transporter permease [Nocardioidaceae bacterium]|nr:ABC transporter permease [Nocardioidaceae bacterium]
MTAAASTIAPSPDWRLAVVLVALVAVGVSASYLGRLEVERETVTATLRAGVQLAVVSLVITAALSSLWWSLLFSLLMLVVATRTSAKRIDARGTEVLWVGAAIAAGVLPVLLLVLGSGVIPFNGAGLVPTAGIIIGNTMTAATLTGRRAYDELSSQFGSYEAGLALGLESKAASLLVIQPSAREALTPNLDKTRTVGLVTLPGAFVGVLLGGGTPLEAGAAQILVLVGIVAAQAVTSAVLLRLVAEARVVRDDMRPRYPR